MQGSAFTVQFGKRLRVIRKRHGFSQEDLAFHARLHRSHISLIETGKRSIRLETVYGLAAALGVQPSELMPPISIPSRPRFKN